MYLKKGNENFKDFLKCLTERDVTPLLGGFSKIIASCEKNVSFDTKSFGKQNNYVCFSEPSMRFVNPIYFRSQLVSNKPNTCK